LPTTPLERSRSIKISATWSSSRIATRVSWALEEMIISLVMPGSLRGLHGRRATELRRTYQEARQDNSEERDEIWCSQS
jgi:hypothetical protein